MLFVIEKYFLWSISMHVGRRDSWPIISLRWLLANQNSQGCHPFNKVQRRCPYCIQVLLPENEGQCLHHCRQGICLTDWGWYLFHETLTTEPWGADYYSNNRFPAVYRMHMLETPHKQRNQQIRETDQWDHLGRKTRSQSSGEYISL